MKLFTQTLYQKLLENGKNRDQDHFPVVKLFTPDAQCTWLLSEIDPDDNNVAFGLCDLGMGFPELGDVYLPELEEARGQLGLPIERDRHFEAQYPMSVYAQAAHANDTIVTDKQSLLQAKAALEAQRSQSR